MVLAVPDGVVTLVAGQLAGTGLIRSSHTILHLSGVLDRSALAPLEPSGAALGSLHPLQTLADPLSAPKRLRGAVAGIEGDDRARAVATTLARAVGLHPVVIPPAGRARHHAAAVFASNYIVVLAALGRDLLADAGLSQAEAWRAIRSLVLGALENLRANDPEAALTGPVVRADVDTIRRDLTSLGPRDARLYRALGQVALEVASLPANQRKQVEDALEAGGAEER